VPVSDAPGTDVQSQVRDAIAFLRMNRDEIRRAVEFAGVDDARLDFGRFCRLSNDVVAQFDYFPPELLRLTGELGLGIEVSLYLVSDEDPE
jgi:hypothetical protein